MKSIYEKPSEKKKRIRLENIKRAKKFQRLRNRLESIMPSGKVKWFDSKKGYGFIKDNESEKDIFLHVSSLEKSKLRVLKENQELEFEIKEEKGKLQAVNLKRIKE